MPKFTDPFSSTDRVRRLGAAHATLDSV